MGLTFSLLQKLGLPSLQSASTDKIFDNFNFDKVKNFEEFHIAFINVCNAFNTIMPGKRFKAPPVHDIEKAYEKWKLIKEDDPQKKEKEKELLLELVSSHVSESAKEDSLIIVTGVVAPAAAMALKKSGENVPQLKKFKLNFIPDVLFVPSFTVLALVGVKMLQVNSTSKTVAIN